MKSKPEISYDRETKCFRQDGKPITDDQALERWEAIDSDWTMGAFDEMTERVLE